MPCGADFTAHLSPSLASLGKELRDELLVQAAPLRRSQGEDPAFARLRGSLDTQSESTGSVLKCLFRGREMSLRQIYLRYHHGQMVARWHFFVCRLSIYGHDRRSGDCEGFIRPMLHAGN